MIDYAGQVAIVTGAGRGLGRLYAIDLARRGAAVVVNDLGGTMHGDCSDTAVADQVVQEIIAAGGHAVASHDSVASPEGGRAIVEERLVVGGPSRRLARRAGDAFDFDASHVHRMCKDDAALAVSIHVYSPPLWRMGAYEVKPTGELQRHSISYAEELRPLAAGPVG